MLAAVSVNAAAQDSLARTSGDPRIGLSPGLSNAGVAASGLALVGHGAKPDDFLNPANPGDFGFLNGDLAFKGNYVFQGGFHGIQIWDVSNPANPTLRLKFVCPGGQGDVSVYRNLMFMSVEETRGRVDCGGQGVTDTVSAERFRGVRIFDISDIGNPKQLAAVQTCRGSHTHTLVMDPSDKANIYVYVSGTSVVRSPNELAGCSGKPPEQDTSTSLFRIDIIKVPLAAPQNARVIASPRIFADSGRINGLWMGGTHGQGTQTTSSTNQCHDITVYSAIHLAAGACSGNGILLDITHPAKPKRIAQAIDPNFAYWHSATFSNDGSKVIFTDEWGGGTQPRCRATDPMTWGADALFTISGGKLHPTGYYKLPVAQTETENCVAHNGALIPVPGRDIMAQGWYQGGVSVFDFTDASHPKEIAFFDRGPMDASKLYISGSWGAYWYNGHLYSSEIGRGLDILDLRPSDNLSQNEIDAAMLVHTDLDNPQNQQRIVWPASFAVSRAYVDQLVRGNGISSARSSAIRTALENAEGLRGGARTSALTRLAGQIDRDAKTSTDAAKVRLLASSVRALASAR
jgi:hypothetical protein